MSDYTLGISAYLFNAAGDPVGMLGRDGREWLFPSTVTPLGNGGADLRECAVLFDRLTGAPVGYLTPYGQEYLFPTPLTFNSTTRGLTIRAAIETMLGAAPQGIGGDGGGWSWPVALIGPDSYTGITQSTTLSATTGVAPFGVFFDSSGTTAENTTEPWRDLLFAFDSGDTASGNYTYGTRVGSNKRKCMGGPAFGHVYETPGTYTASAWVYDGVVYVKQTFIITVQDPDVVYSDTNTICASVTGTFTGAPSGAATQTVATFQAAVALLATGKRVMLQGSDVWGSTAVGALSGTIADAMLTSFNGTAVVTATGTHFAVNITSASVSKLNIHGFDYNAASLSQGFLAVDTARQINTVTLHNVYAYDIGSLITTNGTARIDNLTIHRCRVERVVGGGGKVGIYGAYTNAIIQDTLVNDASSGEHNIRFPYMGKGFVNGVEAHNPAATKHALTLRAPTWGGGAVVNLAVNSYTEYVVVSDCKFSSNTAQICTVTAQGQANNERIRRVVWERNYTATLGGTSSYALATGAIGLISRNNVFNATNGNNSPAMILTVLNDNYTTDGIESHNDTIYRAGTGSALYLFYNAVSVSATNCKLYKGLAYAPLITSTPLVFGTVTQSENVTTVEAKNTNPLFSGALTEYAHFTLEAGSPYVERGVTDNKNYHDGSFKLRAGGIGSIGAHESVSNMSDAWSLFP